MDDLRNGAVNFGLDVEVRKMKPEEVIDAPKPLIAHFHAPASAAGTPGEQRDHFVVLTSILGDGSFLGIDSNNLMPTTYSANKFARGFSGYCLVGKQSLASRLLQSRTTWLALTLAIMVGVTGVLGRYLRDH